MASAELLDVDPRGLRLPPARSSGADPAKLQRQIAQYGRSIEGMPRLICFRAADEELVIYDGVTRATRVAKLSPGTLVTAEIIGRLKGPAANLPAVQERLP